MTSATDRELALLLAPTLAALDRLPREVRDPLELALSSTRSVLALAAAQASASEGRAAHARAEADEARARGDRITSALDDAVVREQQRWTELAALVARSDAAPSCDDLVRALGLDGPVADPADFDRWMTDTASPLALRPSPDSIATSDVVSRLTTIARPYLTPPLDEAATSALLQRCHLPDEVVNDARCGACVRYESGAQAVLLGDGTAVLSRTGSRVRCPVALEPTREVAIHRWASGAPPVLVPAARAALAGAQASRAARPRNGDELAAESLFGAAVRIHADRAPTVIDLARAILAVLGAAAGGARAGAWLEVAYQTLRVTVHVGAGLEDPASSRQSVIDVGRVRWCTVLGRPVVWLPLQSDDPDAVGGTDRAWTLDPPAAGSAWHAASPALRLDRDWHAPVVVDPERGGALLAVAPDGSWWDLDADLEAIALARRAHIEPWLRALEDLERDLPARIAGARSLSAGAPRRALPAADRTRPGAPSSERFTREWIRERADRYAYDDDAPAREAGARAAAAGGYTRDDFLTVVRWKSARALPLAERNTSTSIEARTREAFAAADEIARVAALLRLEGVGVPIASALLHFAFPDAYPILDYRALATLGDTRIRTQYSPTFWAEYVDRCRRLARDAGVSIRQLDKALWQDSKDSA